MKDKTKGIMGNSIETVRDTDSLFIPDNYRGSIAFNMESANGKRELAESVCPTKALLPFKENYSDLLLDYGKCIMCGYCAEITPKLIKINSKPASPVNTRASMIERLGPQIPSLASYEQTGNELRGKIQELFGRSLAIREVDAGSCNGCEVEITALNNPIYDIERFGIHFVSSPRHADLLLVTGPASKNMEVALKRTYDAMPGPKIVIAVGACACSGGIFGDTYSTTGGIGNVIPVDVYIPGCPPRPQTLLCGILLAIGRTLSHTK